MTQKLRVWHSHDEIEICSRSAKLADIDGCKCVFFTSTTTTENSGRLWLHRQFLNFQNLDIPTAKHWDKLDLTDLLPTTPSAFSCTGLDLLDGGDSVVIALRTGEIISVQTETGEAEVVGEFSDDSPAKSGILCLGASPDGEVLVVVSPVKVTVMSSYWDLIAEAPLEDIGHSACVSWRGDGEFFVVSVKAASGLVNGLVFNRDAQQICPLDARGLQAEDGDLGHVLAWQPRAGGMICHAGPASRVSFFERNGLRHLRSDFEYFASQQIIEGKSSAKILDIAWSHDSEKLSIVWSHDDVFSLNIFIRNNYKWYNKKQFILKEKPAAILWDEDECNSLFILTVARSLVYLQLHPVSASLELASRTHVAVVDGATALLTDFCRAVIPPPMSHGAVVAEASISHVSGIPSRLGFSFLLSNGAFRKSMLSTALSTVPIDCAPLFIPNDKLTKSTWTLNKASDSGCLVSRDRMAVLLKEEILLTVRCEVPQPWASISQEFQDEICAFKLSEGLQNAQLLAYIKVDGSVMAVSAMKSSTNEFLVASDNGKLLRVRLEMDGDEATLSIKQEIPLKFLCDVIRVHFLFLKKADSEYALMQSKSGMLVLVNLKTEHLHTISRDCTSFELYRGFLNFTTRNHVLYCMAIEEETALLGKNDSVQTKSLLSMLSESASLPQQAKSGQLVNMLPESYGATRPIDRGSRIVAALADDVRIVLQAPRGNLETIAPRPIVLARVRELSRCGEYGKAFRLSRQQRIDMNELVDVDVDAFLADIDKFVVQVAKASHISIFLTYLKGGEERTNSICDAVVKALKGGDLSDDIRTKCFPALLTAHVRKRPSEYENALLDIWNEHNKDGSRTESHIDYLFVLCKDDAVLYKHALGTYNLSLAVLVAKTSKELDPAEYTEELRSLHQMSEHERHFEIDLKLGRNEKALRHLYSLEKGCDKHIDSTTEANGSIDSKFTCEGSFARSVSFAIEKALFHVALELFRDNGGILNRIRSAYGAHLMTLEKYSLAATVFLASGDVLNAAHSYDLNGNWKLAIGAISRCDLTESKRLEFIEGVAQRLEEREKTRDFAYIIATYLKDVDGALDRLLSAELWSDAIELVSRGPIKERWKAVEDAVITAGTTLTEDLKSTATKVRERGSRLLVVKETKRILRERISAQGGIAGEGSDVFSATTASSFVSNVSDLSFVGRSAATSVYTTASGTVSSAQKRKEKQAQRRNKKSLRKRVKEGHPREEDYLVQYLKNMIPGEFLNNRVEKMTIALLFFRIEELGTRVASAMDTLVDECERLPDDVLESEEVKERLRQRPWRFSEHI